LPGHVSTPRALPETGYSGSLRAVVNRLGITSVLGATTARRGLARRDTWCRMSAQVPTDGVRHLVSRVVN